MPLPLENEYLKHLYVGEDEFFKGQKLAQMSVLRDHFLGDVCKVLKVTSTNYDVLKFGVLKQTNEVPMLAPNVDLHISRFQSQIMFPCSRMLAGFVIVLRIS